VGHRRRRRGRQQDSDLTEEDGRAIVRAVTCHPLAAVISHPRRCVVTMMSTVLHRRGTGTGLVVHCTVRRRGTPVRMLARPADRHSSERDRKRLRAHYRPRCGEQMTAKCDHCGQSDPISRGALLVCRPRRECAPPFPLLRPNHDAGRRRRSMRNHQPPTTNYQPPTTDHQLPPSQRLRHFATEPAAQLG